MTHPSLSWFSLGGIWKSIRPTFLAWEILRPLYNLALVAFSLYWLNRYWPGWTHEAELVFLIIQGAAVANLLYFAGPVAEIYFTWLGMPRWLVRSSLLLCGTLIAAALAYLCFVIVQEHGAKHF